MSPPHTIAEDEAIGFAQRYDPQYFHTDPIAARDSLFGGLACGAFQTAALAWALVLESRMFDQCTLAGIGVDDHGDGSAAAVPPNVAPGSCHGADTLRSILTQ